MSDSYDYDQMATYISGMVDEAINSTMSWLGFQGSTESGFDGSLGLGSDIIRISPLGGRYEGSTFVKGGQVTDVMTGGPASFVVLPEYGFPFHDLQGMIDYYWKAVDELFDPWWQIPRPEDFAGQVQQAHQAAHLLAYQGQSKPGPGVAYFTPNPGLQHIQTIQQRVSNLDGAALVAFEDNFSNRMDEVVNAQDAAACLAWVGVAGEQSIWARVRDSLANIAGPGVEAMKQARGGGADIKGLINVLGAIALVTAEVASDGLATPLVVAGVTAQTASDFIPEPAEKEETELGADTPIGVIDHLREALDRLKASIRQEEDWIATRMQKMTDIIYGGQRGGFDLAQPALTHVDQKSELYAAHEIQANYDVMQTVADVYLRDVADELTNAASMLADTGPDPWIRPGDIGRGHSGPYAEWSGLNVAVKGAAAETARSINQAADALVILVKDFGESDAQVKADMDALATKLDAQATASASAH